MVAIKLMIDCAKSPSIQPTLPCLFWATLCLYIYNMQNVAMGTVNRSDIIIFLENECREIYFSLTCAAPLYSAHTHSSSLRAKKKTPAWWQILPSDQEILATPPTTHSRPCSRLTFWQRCPIPRTLKLPEFCIVSILSQTELPRCSDSLRLLSSGVSMCRGRERATERASSTLTSRPFILSEWWLTHSFFNSRSVNRTAC